jgi:hypothetical protein
MQPYYKNAGGTVYMLPYLLYGNQRLEQLGLPEQQQ